MAFSVGDLTGLDRRGQTLPLILGVNAPCSNAADLRIVTK